MSTSGEPGAASAAGAAGAAAAAGGTEAVCFSAAGESGGITSSGSAAGVSSVKVVPDPNQAEPQAGKPYVVTLRLDFNNSGAVDIAKKLRTAVGIKDGKPGQTADGKVRLYVIGQGALGAAAKAARLAAGVGQATAAARLGVHVQTIGRVEAGEPGVSSGHMVGLLALYGVTVTPQPQQEGH